MVKFITKQGVNKHLNNKKNIKSLLFTGSTNDDLKRLILKGKNVDAVISEKQFKGRGRLSRKFHSPTFSGIYMSIRLKNSFNFVDIGKITTCVAVLVCRAIESLYNVKLNVKWVNDIFLNGKKVAGILAESVINKGKIDSVIIGIGLNVYDKKFPLELKEIATNLEKESGKKVDRNLIVARILENIDLIYNLIKGEDFINEYKRRLFILDKKVTVTSGESSFKAVCKDVTADGKLIVQRDENLIEISVGDVSVKPSKN